MASSLTIITDSTEGRHFDLQIDKTGDDTATLHLQIWSSSLDHRRDDPTKDDTIKLYNICFEPPSRRLVCKADMNGSNPTLTVMLNGPVGDAKPYVRTLIAGTFAGLADASTDYPMDKARFEEFKQFIMEAGFPPIKAAEIRNEKTVLKPW
jgi:hypothetical protein